MMTLERQYLIVFHETSYLARAINWYIWPYFSVSYSESDRLKFGGVATLVGMTK